jgi:hypothetical protein
VVPEGAVVVEELQGLVQEVQAADGNRAAGRYQ